MFCNEAKMNTDLVIYGERVSPQSIKDNWKSLYHISGIVSILKLDMSYYTSYNNLL